MTLVDTSVWVGHFRSASRALRDALHDGTVGVHPVIIGELALGQLRERQEILELLSNLPAAAAAADDEVLELVERERLWGSGIGWVDAHLLCACRLAGWRLWTADKALGRLAARLDLAPS